MLFNVSSRKQLYALGVHGWYLEEFKDTESVLAHLICPVFQSRLDLSDASAMPGGNSSQSSYGVGTTRYVHHEA